MDCAGKNVVISGAANGILFETAKTFIKNGVANIAILDIQDPTAKYKALFPTMDITYIKVDVTKRPMIEDAFKQIQNKWKRIDMVVNGCGVLNEPNLELTVGVNFIGVLYSTFVAIDYMSVAKGGHGGVIVNIASVLGLDPLFSVPIYAATKHGIVGFTDSLANDFYKQLTGIEFVTMCPGVTDTALVAPFAEMVIYPETKKQTEELLTIVPHQSAEVCAENILNSLKKSKNGSFWIIDDGKYHEVQLTRYWNYGN